MVARTRPDLAQAAAQAADRRDVAQVDHDDEVEDRLEGSRRHVIEALDIQREQSGQSPRGCFCGGIANNQRRDRGRGSPVEIRHVRQWNSNS